MCSVTTCRSFVTTTLESDLFENEINRTPDAQLVDVRTPEEYVAGHLPESILINVKAESFDSLIQQLDKSRPVFVYCRTGRRSLEAANILEKNKFKIVYNLEGGIIAWQNKGKATVSN